MKRIIWLLLLLASLGLGVFLLSGCDGCSGSGDDFCPIPGGTYQLELERDAGA